VDVFDRYGFGPNHIFNANESGVSNVKKQLYIINTVQKWARVARRFERSRNIALYFAISASGLFGSHVLIFLGPQMTPSLSRGMLTLEEFILEEDNKIQRNNMNTCGAMVKRREVTKRENI
jgi:hypothetical protein